MMERVAWPTVKRSLVAILRGIRPDASEVIVEIRAYDHASSEPPAP